MGNIAFLIIMIPVSLLFTCLGIYAWRKKDPMWFFAGISVSAEEITDVPAYNKANGKLWIAYSFIFWISAICGFFKAGVGGIILIVGCPIATIALPLIYNKIYNKYKK